jgi:hypothetical protein
VKTWLHGAAAEDVVVFSSPQHSFSSSTLGLVRASQLITGSELASIQDGKPVNRCSTQLGSVALVTWLQGAAAYGGAAHCQCPTPLPQQPLGLCACQTADPSTGPPRVECF